MVVLFLIFFFLELHCFPQWLYQFTSSTTVQGSALLHILSGSYYVLIIAIVKVQGSKYLVVVLLAFSCQFVIFRYLFSYLLAFIYLLLKTACSGHLPIVFESGFLFTYVFICVFIYSFIFIFHFFAVEFHEFLIYFLAGL